MISFCMNTIKVQPLWVLCVLFLGFLSFLKNTLSLSRWIYIYFVRQHKKLKKYGSWALITGSTDGIGKSFAFQLAKEGLNIVLVSRNHQKLEEVKSEIQERYPNVQIKNLALDFSADIGNGLMEMKEMVKELDIGILINNVGVTYPGASYFHEVDENIWMNLVKVNVKGTTLVTKAVLPGMLERKKGAIINLGSGASIVVPSHPLYAIYAATKAYVDQLSRSLYVEYSGRGIDVQCQVPLYVSTKMASSVAFVEKTSLFIPSADEYVKAAIRQIGYGPRCTPYWSHSVQWCFASMLPEFVLDASRLSVGLKRMKAVSH